VSLGEMQTVMLQKMEEMTLHMIKLCEENEELYTNNEELQAVNAQLMKRLEALEEKVENHETN